MRIQTLLNWCLFRFCFKDLSWRLFSPSKLFGTTVPFSSQPQLRWCSWFSLFPTALCVFPYLWCSSRRFLRPRWFLCCFCSICFSSVTFGMRQHIFATQYNPKRKCFFFWWESGVWRGFLGQFFRLRNLAESIAYFDIDRFQAIFLKVFFPFVPFFFSAGYL